MCSGLLLLKEEAQEDVTVFVECGAQASTAVVSGKAWDSHPVTYHGSKRLSLLTLYLESQLLFKHKVNNSNSTTLDHLGVFIPILLFDLHVRVLLFPF